MKTVHDLLKAKGAAVITVDAESTVYDALKLMSDENIGAVMVVDAGGTPVGIMTERDYARKVILAGRASREMQVSEIMTRKVVYVRGEQSVEEAMAIMTGKRCRHLPVMEDGRLAGIISIGDVVKAALHEKEFMIQQLENYIAGSL